MHCQVIIAHANGSPIRCNSQEVQEKILPSGNGFSINYICNRCFEVFYSQKKENKMSNQEFISSFQFLLSAFPSFKISENTIAVYAKMFKDMQADDFQKLVENAVKKCVTFPTVAELYVLHNESKLPSNVVVL